MSRLGFSLITITGITAVRVIILTGVPAVRVTIWESVCVALTDITSLRCRSESLRKRFSGSMCNIGKFSWMRRHLSTVTDISSAGTQFLNKSYLCAGVYLYRYAFCTSHTFARTGGHRPAERAPTWIHGYAFCTGHLYKYTLCTSHPASRSPVRVITITD